MTPGSVRRGAARGVPSLSLALAVVVLQAACASASPPGQGGDSASPGTREARDWVQVCVTNETSLEMEVDLFRRGNRTQKFRALPVENACEDVSRSALRGTVNARLSPVGRSRSYWPESIQRIPVLEGTFRLTIVVAEGSTTPFGRSRYEVN